MLRKNTASQTLCFAGVNATTGAALTGASWTGRKCLDGTFSSLTATVTEDTGTGFYKVALAQGDTNANDLAYFFTATNAVPVCINALTTAADPSDTVRFGLTALPNVASGSAGAIITSGTGTAQLSVTSGVAQADAAKIGGQTASASGTITFPNATLASTTNITAATGITVATNNDKTGYSLTQTFPSNFSALSITAGGVAKADLETIKTQTVTCAGGVTIPAATLASTTNITAGTITTVTNLTNAPTNGDLTATMKASVNAEVDTALIDIGLDHLVSASVAGTDITDNSIIAKLVSKSATADWDTYVNTTDSHEALRDRGDAAWITATGFSTHSAGDVWAVATRVLTAATNISGPIADQVWEELISDHSGTSGSTAESLNAAGSAGDPWTTALPGAYSSGQAGNIIGNLSVPTANAVADAVLSRSASNVEDTAAEHTLCGVILAMMEHSISGTSLTIKKTDGSTTFATKTLTTNPAAEPITGID